MTLSKSFLPLRAGRWVWFRVLNATRSLGESIRRHIRMRRYSGIAPFPILGNNCVAGRIYHDLGWPFLTPTINLWTSVGDFVRLVKFYEREGTFPVIVDATKEFGSPYPVGRTESNEVIHFLHYRTFEEAIDAWNRRLNRFLNNGQKPVLIVADNSDCSDADIEAFLSFPYKKKMVVHDRRKAALLGTFGVFSPVSKQYGTNISVMVGWTGKRKYHGLFPFRWLLGDANVRRVFPAADNDCAPLASVCGRAKDLSCQNAVLFLREHNEK